MKKKLKKNRSDISFKAIEARNKGRVIDTNVES